MEISGNLHISALEQGHEITRRSTYLGLLRMCRRQCCRRRSLEGMKTLISFTAEKQTGGVRDRRHFFSALRGNVFLSLTYSEAEGEVTLVLSEKS